MNAHRVETVISQDGILTIEGVPFNAGDAVEVIILERREKADGEDRYPLRGQPVSYDAPDEPVAEAEWGVLR